MKHTIRTIGIAIGGLIILPFWLTASIILGEDAIDWFERRINKRMRK